MAPQRTGTAASAVKPRPGAGGGAGAVLCRVPRARIVIRNPDRGAAARLGRLRRLCRGDSRVGEAAVGRSAREIAARVLSGAGHVPVPRWYGDLTAGLVPESLRHGLSAPL